MTDALVPMTARGARSSWEAARSNSHRLGALLDRTDGELDEKPPEDGEQQHSGGRKPGERQAQAGGLGLRGRLGLDEGEGDPPAGDRHRRDGGVTGAEGGVGIGEGEGAGVQLGVGGLVCVEAEAVERRLLDPVGDLLAEGRGPASAVEQRPACVLDAEQPGPPASVWESQVWSRTRWLPRWLRTAERSLAKDSSARWRSW